MAAAAAEAALAAGASRAGLARAEAPAWPVVVGAAAATVVVARLLLDHDYGHLAIFGILWLAAGLLHHAAGDLAPRWDGREVSGTAHWAWDLAYHAPSVLAAALGLRGSAGSDLRGRSTCPP